MRTTSIAIAALAACALAAQGCIVHQHVHPRDPEPTVARRHGPPPHAPAHGYRYKQHHHGGEVTLEFDAGLGAYVVVGHRDHYWIGDHYLRWSGVRWEVSADLDGGWVVVAGGEVPARLAARYAHRGHGHGRKHFPAKRAY